ncbi:aspartyl-tRNA synthetase [Angomonas deanei]|uniref:aspartate--tRNA ligase n=1 Tax=Angomonas deanei TaxID=59799 RepID=S9V6B3_9TRYP|nr:aspartyl-tRNA synthetase [Angomonas deanei]EPY38582.1 aspartyl-tRNA synthetase [Angomonas deanei]EPY42587.1 aspartyl-tRNA synthetase [Angomonas deanei]CAD2218263.1 OB-fold nucleic acid binding domain/tRNA synthetases class II (D, K and N), putative [Angomonas deanei]|eukprot:EPY34111.1 aspartyl-tRNA synthetase [Angomonas deanei]
MSDQQPAATPEEPKINKKQAEKEARIAARLAEEKARAEEKAALLAKYSDVFGNAELLQSTGYNTKEYTKVPQLSAALADKTVTVRARVSTTRKKGKLAFMVIRDENSSVQAMAAVDEARPKEMIDYIGQIPCESIVDVEAKVTVVDQPITSTTHSDIELQIQKIHCISESQRTLPFTLEDASRREDEEGAKVNSDTRLNCRWLDLRTPASNAIFRMQSRVCQHFRQYLLDNDFFEIHTPKIISAASEGGSNVFKLQYFNRDAFLAQSPQLYKQMVLQGDLPRVFEVAPVFRAENSNTHRHLTEFVGLDVELRINEHYYEVLDLAEGLFNYMFEKLATHTKELEDIRAQYPFEPLVWKITEEKIKELGIGIISENKQPTDQYEARVHNLESRMLRLNYPHCIELLNTVLEEKLAPTDDINTTNEKLLGKLVRERYGVDFFISDRFPSTVRPFYTMPCKDDTRFTNSYDMFIRGEEISSGAQRIHVPEMLLERAKSLQVDLTPCKDYVDSFRLGAWPHGGFGVGMERVVMLYLGLSNVRLVSMFPRDPQRVTP